VLSAVPAKPAQPLRQNSHYAPALVGGVPDQAAISASVRPQPTQSIDTWSTLQTLTQDFL
jgi:hypothetical protein